MRVRLRRLTLHVMSFRQMNVLQTYTGERTTSSQCRAVREEGSRREGTVTYGLLQGEEEGKGGKDLEGD
jgi:hypothetical protein